MTRLQKLQLRQSESRQALGALLDTEDDKRTDTYEGDLAKATVEVRSLESELQAALVAGEDEPAEQVTTDTPEGREMRQLIDNANIGEIFDAALERRSIDGATRDLQQHHNLAENQVPLDLLEARAITPAPAEVGQEQHAIVPYVFPSSVSEFLSIPQPRVPVGDAVVPVLTSTLAVGHPAEGAAQAETTGAFSADVLSPQRIQASFFYSREDAARFAGLDSALRENLSMGLADGLDKAIVAGTNGLLTGSNLDANAVSAEATFASYLSDLVYSRVDGRYADTAQALRIVCGTKTYAHAGSVFRQAETDRTALDRLMQLSGGVRVSAHVPAVASTKQQVIVRLGARMDAVAAIWEGITLVPDSVSGIAKGTIAVTAIMLHAVKVLRKDGFHKQEVKLS